MKASDLIGYLKRPGLVSQDLRLRTTAAATMLERLISLADELEANADRYKDATALANIAAKRIREILEET